VVTIRLTTIGGAVSLLILGTRCSVRPFGAFSILDGGVEESLNQKSAADGEVNGFRDEHVSVYGVTTIDEVFDITISMIRAV